MVLRSSSSCLGLLLMLLLGCGTSIQFVEAQTTCANGRISLLSLETTTFTVGTTVYTFGFCNAVDTPLPSLTSCSATGYVQAHNTVNSACLASYSDILTGLTLTSTGAFFAVQDAAKTQIANVTVTCDRSATSGDVSLVQPVVSNTVGGITTTTFELLALAGCAMDSFFCSSNVSCSDSTKTCLQGVCFDTSCATVTTVASAVKGPASFLSELSVEDCHGTPLSNLPNSSFAVTLNGVNVEDPVIKDEVIHIIGTAAELPVPMLTTLLLDQSQSVLNNGQSILKEAARAFIDVVLANSTNHYVAIVAFDGSPSPVTVLPHSNDKAALMTAVDTQLPPAGLTDPGSTDLFTAVIDGLDEAYRMTFSFGNTSSSLVSSMIVFTDGHDTAKRTTSAAAIVKAATLADKVKILAVGTTATSDTAFLSAIATSGFYQFVSLSNLVQTFADAAAKLVSLTTNNYHVMMCVPSRSVSVPITVGLDPVQFPSANSLQFDVNASNFTGGCTEAVLNAEIKEVVAEAVPQVEQLLENVPLSKTIVPGGAFFFWGQYTSALTLVVSPAYEVFYVKTQRCILSQYCADGNFTNYMILEPNVRYDAVVRPKLETMTTVLIYVTTATPLPGVTPGVNVPPAHTPVPVNLSALTDESGPSDVDEPATYIFFGTALTIFFGLLFVASRYRSGQRTKKKQLSQFKRRAQREAPTPREVERGLLDQPPVYSDIQPYRHETPKSSRVAVFDRSADIEPVTPQSHRGGYRDDTAGVGMTSYYMPPESIDYEQSTPALSRMSRAYQQPSTRDHLPSLASASNTPANSQWSRQNPPSRDYRRPDDESLPNLSVRDL